MAKQKTRALKPRKPGLISTAAGILAGAMAALAALLRPAGALMLASLGATWRNRTTRRISVACAGLCVCAAIALAMLASLRKNESFQVDPGRIELTAQPRWAKAELAGRVKADIEKDLRGELARMAATDAFDATLPESLADALSHSPWVRSVVRVERRFPQEAGAASRLHPLIEVRTPALMVECAERVVLVDGEGVVLPLGVNRATAELAAFKEQLVTPLRVVKGVRGMAPQPGQTWKSEQINAALSMEQILRKSEIDSALPIEAIELIGVPEHADTRGRVHYAADGCVMLWPDQLRFPESRLIWGRPPIHASTLEASPNEKLAELKKALDQPDLLNKARVDLRRRVAPSAEVRG